MLNTPSHDLQELFDFLGLRTPASWVQAAMKNIPILLLDHAHCERKAAATAINFISRYPEKSELVNLMSPLAREELLHFEKVKDLMHDRNIEFGPLQASDYAQSLHRLVPKNNSKERLRDLLIIASIIEARSCERFHALSRSLDDLQLTKFYTHLIRSEVRHFQDYLHLARLYGGNIEERVRFLVKIENKLISSKDPVFRFHSGIPEGRKRCGFPSVSRETQLKKSCQGVRLIVTGS